MCKKLTFVLAMLAIAVPTSAIERGIFNEGDSYPGDNILLKVDIDANGSTGPNHTQPGWTAWEMPEYWSSFGPVTKNFGSVIVTLDGVTATGGGGHLAGSRDRIHDPVSNCDCDFPLMYKDLVYVPHTASCMGEDYFEVAFNFGPSHAGETYQFTFWGWDVAFGGSGYGSGSAAPPNSKWMAWSATNPDQWLNANGYPSGYDCPNTPGESNMPADLMALTELALAQGRAPWLTCFDDSHGMTFAATLEAQLDESGRTTIYGWADMQSMVGSQHAVLNGFMISVPEPATIALLGLGGLTIPRKRRHKKT